MEGPPWVYMCRITHVQAGGQFPGKKGGMATVNVSRAEEPWQERLMKEQQGCNPN